jgi:predicted RNA-binding protein associated with RNAse of E/G family
VWVFRREDEFAGWYVNFQEPFRRWDGGFDTQDLELDIWIPRDGPWEWKDREALEERVREGRFTAEQAAQVRAEADAVAANLDAGRSWWDAAWAEWSPGSSSA